jgi:hypothetical protein
VQKKVTVQSAKHESLSVAIPLLPNLRAEALEIALGRAAVLFRFRRGLVQGFKKRS